MFGLYRLDQQRFPTLGVYLKIQFIQDSGLFRVWFRQISRYILLIKYNNWIGYKLQQNYNCHYLSNCILKLSLYICFIMFYSFLFINYYKILYKYIIIFECSQIFSLYKTSFFSSFLTYYSQFVILNSNVMPLMGLSSIMYFKLLYPGYY